MDQLFEGAKPILVRGAVYKTQTKGSFIATSKQRANHIIIEQTCLVRLLAAELAKSIGKYAGYWFSDRTLNLYHHF